MKHVFLLIVLVFASARVHAQEWNRDAAVNEMRDLVLTQRPMDEWPERNRAIAAWLERVEESGLDLGGYGFLLGVAMYFNRDYAGGGAQMFDYLQTYGTLPDEGFNPVAGRLMMMHAVTAVADGDLKSGRAAIPHALALYSDVRTVYRAVAKTLQQSRQPEALAALNELLAQMLTDERMNDGAKQLLLRELYGPKLDIPSIRRNAPASPTSLKSFTAKSIDGREVSLETLRGKVVLVDFWATWCPPCMREMPNVAAAYERFKDDGFEIIGISLDGEPGQVRGGAILKPGPDSETTANIRAVMKRYGMDWPIIYEGGGWDTRLAVENGIRSIPATFLIDRTGTVRATNLRGKALMERVAHLVAEEE